jgi:hypothetical protein
MRTFSLAALAAAATCTTLLFTVTPAALGQEVIAVRSGTGQLNGLDFFVTRLDGPATGPFAGPLTPEQFQAARDGSPAFIINRNPAWLATLPTDPAARWISARNGGANNGLTTLYSVDFEVTTPGTRFDATLTLTLACDDALGDVPAGGVNQGLFVNGQPVPDTVVTGAVGTPALVARPIGDLITPGLNTLSLLVVNNNAGALNPSGLLFSATILVAARPLCPADFDQSGNVNPDDLADFIAVYFTDPQPIEADYDGSGTVNPDDLADFIAAYFTPCP